MFRAEFAGLSQGLHNVEPEMNFAMLSTPPEGENAKPPAAGGAATPPISPRTLLTPRQVWSRKPVQLKVPDEEKPTGYYRFNLSKPWERLAAERLAKVQPREGIQPLATISPNLAPYEGPTISLSVMEHFVIFHPIPAARDPRFPYQSWNTL